MSTLNLLTYFAPLLTARPLENGKSIMDAVDAAINLVGSLDRFQRAAPRMGAKSHADLPARSGFSLKM